MSSNNLKRIKTLHQKKNDDFISIPLGVDGLLVDMMSKLDLEEDLKIGNNHFVQILDENQYDTTIIQYYCSESRAKLVEGNLTVRTIPQMMQTGAITHKVEIHIIGSLNVLFLAFDDNQAVVGPGETEEEFAGTNNIVTKKVNQDDEITRIDFVLKERNGESISEVDSQYYKTLHQKSTLIYKTGNDYIVDQQVDTIKFDREVSL